ncbi:hypothetical protein RHGRI_000743 [Rhododendron griersonianum]|uniref:Uncharacterized protein n=1 Tax=Rhododendron griersonianum TaxID=479676 RepID=A0AAV6LHS6_9ERIC|nr:hypothetical protein RHGRI_000743 [Rhododendron griersonianum]
MSCPTSWFKPTVMTSLFVLAYSTSGFSLYYSVLMQLLVAVACLLLHLSYDVVCFSLNSKLLLNSKLITTWVVNGLPCSPVKWVDAVQKMSCRVKADIVPNA